jgi:hypothetical protein
MKRIICIILILFAINAKSQTPQVKISYNIDSAASYNNCSPPFTNYQLIGGTATNVNVTSDSLKYIIDWGDSQNSTGTIPFLSFGTSIYWNLNNGWNFYHTYLNSGIYDFKLVVWSKLTGAKDSLIMPGHIIVGTYCDTISGIIYKDLNNDCIFNNGDTLITNIPTNLDLFIGNGYINLNYYNFNIQNGIYKIIVPAGIAGNPIYKLKLSNSSAFYGVCPSSGEHIFQNFPSIHNDFGFQCNNSYDMGISFTNAVVGFSNLSGRLFFKTTNLSCYSGIATLKIILDTKTHFNNSTPAISSVITASTGDIINYNNLNINSFQNLNFFMNLSTTSSIAVGDTMRFKAIVIPQSNETNLSNNYDSIMIKVVASYDPNDIQVSPFGIIPNLTTLNYSIRFQNTGNAAAKKVVVIDTLASNLDINTIIFKGSSHAVDMHKLPNNIVKFVFEPINLYDSATYNEGSKGYVSFSIKPTGYLPIGTQIPNTAYIYFDDNPAIQTNTVVNYIDSMFAIPVNVNEIPYNDVGYIYPNPATDVIHLVFKDELKDAEVTISELSGRIVLKQQCIKKEVLISLQGIENGLYLIQLKNKTYSKLRKILISN